MTVDDAVGSRTGVSTGIVLVTVGAGVPVGAIAGRVGADPTGRDVAVGDPVFDAGGSCVLVGAGVSVPGEAGVGVGGASVTVGGTDVAVGGPSVAVGRRVGVGGPDVAIGGPGVAVGSGIVGGSGLAVAVGAIGVGVEGAGVAVGWSVSVGGADVEVGGPGVAVGPTGVRVGMVWRSGALLGAAHVPEWDPIISSASTSVEMIRPRPI